MTTTWRKLVGALLALLVVPTFAFADGGGGGGGASGMGRAGAIRVSASQERPADDACARANGTKIADKP